MLAQTQACLFQYIVSFLCSRAFLPAMWLSDYVADFYVVLSAVAWLFFSLGSCWDLQCECPGVFSFLNLIKLPPPRFHLSLFLHILLFLSHSFKNETVNPTRGLPFTHIIWWPWRAFLKHWWHYHCDLCVLLTLCCLFLSCMCSSQIFKRKNRLGTFSEIRVMCSF